MLEYFLSPAKADFLPTDGGHLPASTPLVTGMDYRCWRTEVFVETGCQRRVRDLPKV